MKKPDNMDPWVELAVRVQAIAQAGLAYTEGPYDRERYTELRGIAAEMLSLRADMPADEIAKFFCKETGYQTPKVDTRAAVFRDGKILLVHEQNGTWALPGGWCDVDQSVGGNAVKETREEAGLDVVPEKLVAVHDWRQHNPCNLPYGVIKFFVQCRLLGGHFTENNETTGIRWFARDELPAPLADEKNTAEQILLCFDAHDAPQWQTQFD